MGWRVKELMLWGEFLKGPWVGEGWRAGGKKREGGERNEYDKADKSRLPNSPKRTR